MMLQGCQNNEPVFIIAAPVDIDPVGGVVFVGLGYWGAYLRLAQKYSPSGVSQLASTPFRAWRMSNKTTTYRLLKVVHRLMTGRLQKLMQRRSHAYISAYLPIFQRIWVFLNDHSLLQ
ncbi:hypothetical protein [Desulfopila sp. IMCC35008]|uniref:hypothetical protein n=1 Tax=Desulfopila sp. IMCC35008 TaxID=2653858 RepID=UPI0013D40C0E|nr:hypothetical protein [Desulfopila sp. IMCC35008]